MADLTNYTKEKLINELLRNIDFVPPTSVQLALYTDTTTDAGGGTEVTGGSYARQTVTFSDPSGGGSSTNTADVVFTSMPAATIVSAAILDELGNMLAHDQFSSPKVVNADDDFTIVAGQLNFFFS